MELFKKKQKKSLDLILREVDESHKSVSPDTLRLFKAFWLSLLPVQKYGFERIMKKQLLGGYADDLAKNNAVEAEVCDEEDD